MDQNFELVSHLMRRAGFSSTRQDIEKKMSIGYEETVEELLNPSTANNGIDDTKLRRYHPDQAVSHDSTGAGSYWLYRLISTTTPLQEKIGLFWHNIFATGYAKVTNGKPLTDQIAMFRKYGTGRLDDLLVQLSRDPAMIIWLDNMDNHNGAINENYGRELLELFSMGVGNYTEDDIKECSRAFTGWTIANVDYTKQLAVRNSIWPYGKIAWRYEYDDSDHDSGIKKFLGKEGNFNGDDIINIICQQPSTARFISRHLYHFFVADEPPVPSWPYVEPQDIEAIKILEQAYFDSDHNIEEMLRTLFNSDFFKSKEIYYKKIKSPTELVVQILRITEEFDGPKFELPNRNSQLTYMGQQLLNPPSVEGWHQGLEWIETGSITERVNFCVEQMSDLSNPGISKMSDTLLSNDISTMTSKIMIQNIINELGGLDISNETRKTLEKFADEIGLLNIENNSKTKETMATMLGMIGSVPEFQKC
jgi:uncharacterized protein (DUF1800 family)